MSETDIVAGRRISGQVAGLYVATGKTFQTRSVDSLDVSFEGIVGDRHSGFLRKSGPREPWYPRGIELRNERQLTLLSPDELAATAADMSIDHIQPEWIGGNLLIEGVPDLSMLPASTLLFFDGGVTLKVDFQNGPCRYSGEAIADHYPNSDRAGLALQFVQAAKRRRGLLAWVEKPGQIASGEAVRVQIPEQWIYSV